MADMIMTQTLDALTFDQQIQLIEKENEDYGVELKKIREKYKDRKDLSFCERLVTKVKNFIGQYCFIITI